MSKKIMPNDMCPCGSGKKYKKCCGAVKEKVFDKTQETNEYIDIFIQNRLNEDIIFLTNAVQQIIGPWGYKYCSTNTKMLRNEYMQDEFRTFVEEDRLKLYELTKKKASTDHIKNIRPYGGDVPEIIDDILSLSDKGYICDDAYQIELFHSYVTNNLHRRFNEYFYIPKKDLFQKQILGTFGHRGYDFLLAISLYLELQLGVHVYFNRRDKWHDEEKARNNVVKFFTLQKIKINHGMIHFLYDYTNVIAGISYKMEPFGDMDYYHKIGAYTNSQYKELSKIKIEGVYPPPYDYNYIDYLSYLVPAICFNNGLFYGVAELTFPQNDYLRYHNSLVGIIQLFQDKVEHQELDPAEYFDIESLQKIAKVLDFRINPEIQKQDRLDIYYDLVFSFMDELYGFFYHARPKELVYTNSPDINEDPFSESDNNEVANPARKSTNPLLMHKIIPMIYNLLNGKHFTLDSGSQPGDYINVHLAGCYPILPWISSGKEHTLHIRPFNDEIDSIEMLYSDDILKRQAFLSMEYRLTEIPVNCIEEFLNPDVFFNWKERHELLKETERKNDQLRRHIHLNEELIRSLSHSSANYINSEELSETGLSLQNAIQGNPGLDELHIKGTSLLLHSEQEMYLSRQLNSLVWRCSANTGELSDRMKASINSNGTGVMGPIVFSMKTLLARILMRKDDKRSDFIRSKLRLCENRLLEIQSSYILDILSDSKQLSDQIIFEWWNANICKISLNYSPKFGECG